MNKRFVSGVLWFLSGWFVGAVIAFATGWNAPIALLVGVAAALLVVADPWKQIWPTRAVSAKADKHLPNLA